MGFLLIIVGIVFSFFQILALPFLLKQESFIGALFFWFGGFGIFILFALRMIYGLFKCIRECKK
jgi:hypothetical protein